MTMPDDFYTTYKLVEELRADKTAPVDYDGAEALAEGKAPLAVPSLVLRSLLVLTFLSLASLATPLLVAFLLNRWR